MNIKQEQVKMQ